ncbi:SusC/RagA family TonB-linked outer membrane protein [Flavobacterium psychrotrophum]|uniref:SusC/RagA family TonB-linked outer membrane protein n=1 Tax=Flavobacterium psychrotrophum TaxID=2294119 RepID=UPI000E3156BE|nr:TonB-dependent receptor [Flavobacterium psychrotrophum]
MKNFIFGFLLLMCGISYGQQITGQVVDDSGMPVPDVYITVAGSPATASADIDGNFSIAASEGAQLTFAMIGFENVTVAATTSPMKISLKTSAASNLEEVVVIGYGTQKRSNLTGAVGTVKADQFQKQPQFNAMQSIQGKVAGVQIVTNDSPGATPTVRVRGLGTATAGSGVIYVVDGTVTGDISNINPSDIATMDILKDASSAAIYGSSAANGVVLITTKKGKDGKMNVSVNSTFAARSTLNQVKMANASQYVQYYNENQATLANPVYLSANQPYNTNWYDELTDVGTSTNNNVAVSGGSDKGNYYFSYNNYAEDGILDSNKINRNTIRSNTSFNFFDNKLKLTQNLNYTYTKGNPKPFSAFDEAYRQAPIVPVRYPSGQWGQSFYNQTTGVVGYQAGAGETIGQLNSIGNPLASVAFTNEETKTSQIQGMFDAELKLTDWLKVNTRLGITKSYSRGLIYNDTRGRWLAADPTRTDAQYDAFQATAGEGVYTYANNSITATNVESFRYNWDTFLTANKSFGDHNFTVIAGFTKDKRGDVITTTQSGYNVPTASQNWNMHFAQGATTDELYATPQQILSYFGRVQYDYNEKYFLTANIRRDGNSRFKQNADYWGTFPSVSVGWALTKESFLSDIKGLDFIKIRGGYGLIGNADIGFANATSFLAGVGSQNYNYVFGPNQTLVFGAYAGSPAQPLSWEKTQEVNAGLDFELIDRRLSGSVDYYNRLTTNAILQVNPVRTSPYADSFYDHGAEIRNKGFELALNWKDQVGQDFSYYIGGTLGTNKNTLESVKPAYDGQTGGSLANGQITKRLQEGQAVYSWWMYQADGIWQNQTEIDQSAHVTGAQPGQIKYKDLNGDGQIDDRDKKFFDSYLPTYTYGINIGFAWKGIDLSVDGYGVGGNKVYNGLKSTRINGGENVTADSFNGRWTGEGTSNTNPGANRTAIASSYYLEDGAFFRINNITLGYTFKNIIKDINKIRIYGTAQNPFMFTKYSGFTPEINSNGSPAQTTGIELSAYPSLKTFLVGVQIDL